MLTAMALAWSPNAAAQDWLTTDWTVECVTVSEGVCTPKGTASARAYFEDSLEDSSQWLRGLGFRGPAIEYRSGIDSYIAYISDMDNEDEDGQRKSIGVYYPELKQMYLTSDRYFAIGEGDTEKARADALAFDFQHTATVVHEMFHGVEQSYPTGTAAADWITEGMADAIQLSWIRQVMPNVKMSGNTRTFDSPLHKPKNEEDAYVTSRFWLGVGKILGATNDIQYLHSVLEQDLQSGQGLGGVDMGLRQSDPEGLYNLYPEFIARAANNTVFYDDVAKTNIVYDASKAKEISVRGTVREVAADAHELAVHVPVGKSATLEIRFANDHDNLHLIVDHTRLDDSVGSDRNVFHAAVDGQKDVQTFLVRVANVARNAVDTDPRNYGLEFTLRPTKGESQCTFAATMSVESIGHNKYYIKNGQKAPIKRTESVVGVATISDAHEVKVLTLTIEDDDGSRTHLFGADTSPIEIGGPPGVANVRGTTGRGSPVEGPYKVQLDIVQNADPGDLAGWGEMTLKEQMDSGIGYPERLAMRRLRGKFSATRIERPDCCVGYVETLHGTFDAGNGPYHCEGGLEAMKEGYETMKKLMIDMSGGKPDPSKLDGLLD